MHNQITNRDEIAGLPALSAAEFFAECEPPFTTAEVGVWFHLNDQETATAIQRLLSEGHIELSKNRTAIEFIKTNKALAIEQFTPQSTLSISDYHNIVLTLLRATDEINSSPATAYRIRAVTLIGAAIDGSKRPKSLVEAIIELEPLTPDPKLQTELEALSHEYAVTHADFDRSDEYTSIQFIKDRLLEAHERLSLRFVVK